MTHDELLAKIDEERTTIYEDSYGNVPLSSWALRAVVELHKPVTKTYNSIYGSGFNYSATSQVTQDYCQECHYRYPCNVIRTIEKELV